LTEPNESALHVKPGCTTPAQPANKKRAQNRSGLSSAQFAQRILEGDRVALAQAITLIESSRAEDRKQAEQILEACLPATGNSIRIGITGIPGAGKSCLIEALGKHLIAERNEKVAVLAVDPSSQLSGGSILGDKTRMASLASSDMAYIRPCPSRGTYGGVAQNTRDAILLCEAAGYQNIFVETVGVGQSETAVSDLVDFFLLVTLAGTGDELQGIKRGVMEMAHLVAVNKADGANVDNAKRACAELRNALHFLPQNAPGWTPSAIACSAITGFAVPEIWAQVLEFQAVTKANGSFEYARREQLRHSMHEMAEQALLQMFRKDPAMQHRQVALEQAVLAGSMTTGHAVQELLALFTSRTRSAIED
jgi:LAO/AO transport system kinase